MSNIGLLTAQPRNAWHKCCRYDIEELAEQGDFLDSAYLLLMGELPTAQEKRAFDKDLTMHTLVHEQLIQFFKGFKHDAHPMAIMVGVVGALSAFEPYSADIACAPLLVWHFPRHFSLRFCLSPVPFWDAPSWTNALTGFIIIFQWPSWLVWLEPCRSSGHTS